MTFGAVSGISATAGVIRAATEGGISDPGTLGLLGLLAIPIAAPIALPAGAATGAVSALARWVQEGAWGGLRASGIAGRGLLPAALALGLLAAAPTLGMTAWGEPALRREAARSAARHATSLGFWPGIPVTVGAWTFTPEVAEGSSAGRVLMGGIVGEDPAIGYVERLSILGDPAILRLSGGSLAVLPAAGRAPWRVSWERWDRPILNPDRRIELIERDSPDLLAVARRTEAGGKDASYERAILYKRGAHPLATALFPAALLPFATGSRPLLAVGAAALGYLVAVRGGDHLARTLGPGPAAASGPLLVALLGIAAWASWRDR